MNLFERASDVKGAIRTTTPARVVSVLAGGTLGQRVVTTLGLVAVAFAIYQSLIWGIMLVGGWMLCFFAIRDYERLNSMDAP